MIYINDDLKETLQQDLKSLGFKVTPRLELRGYSKLYNGRFIPRFDKVVVYCFSDKDMTRKYPYPHLLSVAVHEYCHCEQFWMPGWKRDLQIMHDVEFKQMYNMYLHRIERRLRKIDEVVW